MIDAGATSMSEGKQPLVAWPTVELIAYLYPSSEIFRFHASWGNFRGLVSGVRGQGTKQYSRVERCEAIDLVSHCYARSDFDK